MYDEICLLSPIGDNEVKMAIQNSGYPNIIIFSKKKNSNVEKRMMKSMIIQSSKNIFLHN